MSSKIKDGLFMGDVDAAQDSDFLQLNGIVHVINCVPRQVPNIFEQQLGIAYTPCDLDDVLRRPFFDLKNREFMTLVQLINTSLDKTESVLVHSLNGIGRSPSLMVGYLMVTYCWGVDKAHDFVATKRPDIKLHESYIEQLCGLEAQLQRAFPARASEQQLYEWNSDGGDPKTDERVLLHTFLNSNASTTTATALRAKDTEPRFRKNGSLRGNRRLTWIDQNPQLRKLHPGLISKPERPPNHSYSHMQAGNGWIDLVTGSSAANRGDSFKSRRDANDTSTSSAAASAFGSSLANVMASLEVSDAHSEEHKGGRMHSFSVPRKKNNEVIDLHESSPSPTDDSEALEWSSSTASKAQNGPRYLQQTLASINARPRKPLSRPTLYRTPSNPPSSSSGSYLPGGTSTSSSSGSSTSLFTKTASTRDTRASKTVAKMPVKKQQQPHETRTSAPAKANASTARSFSSQSSSRNNALFGGEYPSMPSSSSTAPQRRTTSSSNALSRRSSSDPIEDPTIATSSVRPRTAPPRLRKQEMEINDLLYSKRLDSSTAINTGGSTLGRDAAPTGLKRMSRVSVDSYYDPTPSAPQSARTASRRLSTAASSAASVYSARPKTARAQWK